MYNFKEMQMQNKESMETLELIRNMLDDNNISYELLENGSYRFLVNTITIVPYCSNIIILADNNSINLHRDKVSIELIKEISRTPNCC